MRWLACRIARRTDGSYLRACVYEPRLIAVAGQVGVVVDSPLRAKYSDDVSALAQLTSVDDKAWCGCDYFLALRRKDVYSLVYA
jgi:hypothetical protein